MFRFIWRTVYIWFWALIGISAVVYLFDLVTGHG